MMKNVALKIAVLTILLLPVSLKGQMLKETALHKIDILKSLIAEAEQKGLDAQKEKMTLRTSELFLGYADWDEENYPILLSCFQEKYWTKNYADELASGLPEKERGDVIYLLDEAIETLVLLTDNVNFRVPIPTIDHAQVSFDRDQLMHDGRPVFLHDYMLEPKNVPELNEFYGDYDGEYISPSNIANEQGDIKSGVANRLKNKATGRIGQVWVDNVNPPAWAVEKYGFLPKNDYSGGNRLFTKYDIDNPGAREMMGFLFEGCVPLMADKKYTKLGYMTMNEPHFNTEADTWETGGVSEYTREKFRSWLSGKHKSIGDLNALWGSSFENFDSVKIGIPINSSFQGSPLWYDWMKFNQYRVTDWFIFMRDKIISLDPTAKVHFKVMPRFFVENPRGQGLDFESITRLSHISGNDAGAHYYNKYRKLQKYDSDRYSFYWQETSMTYDFFRSVSPDQIIYNAEVHYDSHDPAVDPEYIRAIYWLAHMHGLNAALTWAWVRDADGSVNPRWTEFFSGTFSQNPLAVDYMAATYMDLNSHSELITAMQRQTKPLRIFYSETSAISKATHMEDVFEIYESLYYDGLSLGYATDSILREQQYDDYEAVLVYKTEFVTQKELDALQDYLNEGGTVITDGISLATDEYGQALTALTPGMGSIITAASLAEIRTRALNILDQADALPEVSITETNSGNGKGCTWKCIKDASGKNVISIVNLGNSDARLRIELKDAVTGTALKDLLTGVPFSTHAILKPREVCLLEVSDAEDPTTTRLPSLRFDEPELYLATNYPNTGSMDVFLYYDAGTGENVMEKDGNGITCKLIEKDAANADVTLYEGSYSTAIGKTSGVANISIDIRGATPTDSLAPGHYYVLDAAFRSSMDEGTDIFPEDTLSGVKIVDPNAVPSLSFDDPWKYQSRDFPKLGTLDVTLNYSAGSGDSVLHGEWNGVACKLIERDGNHKLITEYIASDTSAIGSSSGTALIRIDISGATPTDSLDTGHYYELAPEFRSSRDTGTDVFAEEKLTGIRIVHYTPSDVPKIWMDDRNKYLTTEYINEGTMELYVYYDAGNGHTVMDSNWRGITGQLVEKDENGKGVNWYKSSDLSSIGTTNGLAHIVINIAGIPPTADLDEGHYYGLVPLINSTYNPDKLYYLGQKLENVMVVAAPEITAPSLSLDDPSKYLSTEYPNTGFIEVLLNYDAGTGHTVLEGQWNGITCTLIQKDADDAVVEEYTASDLSAIGSSGGTSSFSIDITGARPTAELEAGHYYELFPVFRSSFDETLDISPEERLTGLIVIDTTTVDTTTSLLGQDALAGLRVYPNPAGDRIYLNLDSGVHPGEVSIYSMQGRLLIRKSYTNELDITALPRGMYLLKYENEIRRFVKNRY